MQPRHASLSGRDLLNYNYRHRNVMSEIREWRQLEQAHANHLLIFDMDLVLQIDLHPIVLLQGNIDDILNLPEGGRTFHPLHGGPLED